MSYSFVSQALLALLLQLVEVSSQTYLYSTTDHPETVILPGRMGIKNLAILAAFRLEEKAAKVRNGQQVSNAY